jgi:hypothetical protein
MNAHSSKPLVFEKSYRLDLELLSPNRIPIEQFIAALNATTTLTELRFCTSWPWKSTSENSRRVIVPLCRCIANLRRNNQNHPLRRLRIEGGNRVDDVERFLVAAKQYGIHHLNLVHTHLPIQSFEEFCRENTYLKVLTMHDTHLIDQDSTIYVSPQNGPPNSSAVLALAELTITSVWLEKEAEVTKFLSIIEQVTYTKLELGQLYVQENKITLMRIVSALIKPSVQQLILSHEWGIEYMDAIEACATVMQIQQNHEKNHPPVDIGVRRQLQSIATRNRELAPFVANPRAYPGDELLALMSQFDNSPTGRFMLALCLPGIPAFFKM